MRRLPPTTNHTIMDCKSIPDSEAVAAASAHQPLPSHLSHRLRVHRSDSKSHVFPLPAAAIRRRPNSVFSRRGIDSPVQAVSPFSMRLLHCPFEPAAGAPPKSRGMARRWQQQQQQQEKPRGCILRAVPPAAVTTAAHDCSPLPTLDHAHVDATMATSPNEEILTNIGCTPSQIPTQPSRPVPILPPKGAIKGGKAEQDAACIGFWRDGQVHWESGVAMAPPLVPQPPKPVIAELDSRPVQLEPLARKDRRPKIQVIIPNGASMRALHAPRPFVPQPVQRPDPRDLVTLAGPVHLDQAAEMPSSSTDVSKHPSFSSSTGTSHAEHDNSKSSVYTNSNRTSWTSVDGSPESKSRQKPGSLGTKASSSIVLPAAAGTFDDVSCVNTTVSNQVASASLSNGGPVPSESLPFQTTIHYSYPPLATQSRDVSNKKGSRRGGRVVSLPARVLAADNHSVPRSNPPSPTLSEAETALEEHLSSIAEQSPVASIARMPSYPCEPAPPPPRKSSRRNRVASLPLGNVANHFSLQQPSTVPVDASSTDTIVPRKPTASSSYTSSREQRPQLAPSQRVIEPEAAENVILCILEQANCLVDLFALACVNRGFYRVYKRNELRAMRATLRNECAPAWEHRESSPPPAYSEGDAEPQLEHTPESFHRNHVHDTFVIAALKSLVLTRCQSFLRPETVMALASTSADRTARIDMAFWRIWTFCTIFGAGKGREDDIVGQTDWLRGGPLAHQTGIRATIMTSDSFDASGALLSAADHFAKGNGPDGLSAEELYDMTEIWMCMGVLLSGLDGRTEQAREFGVFDETHVRGGDIDGEERMLREWLCYVSTLGLTAILQLATASAKTDPAAFFLALENGWMDWTPPSHGASRRTFLKEAVARVYEERISAMAAASSRSSSDDEAHRLDMRQVQRQRMAAHQAEIRTRRRNGDYPLVRMSSERPMSDWEGVFDHLNGKHTTSAINMPTAGHDASNLLAAPLPRRHPSASSSIVPGAPSPHDTSRGDLIALPPLPEVATGLYDTAGQMQERSHSTNQQHPVLHTLARNKHYDYGPSSALRSFLESASSSDSGSIVSPTYSAGDGTLWEEAVHPALRSSVQHPRARKQSSCSSVSSLGHGGAPLSPSSTWMSSNDGSFDYNHVQQQQPRHRYYDHSAVKHTPQKPLHQPHHHSSLHHHEQQHAHQRHRSALPVGQHPLQHETLLLPDQADPATNSAQKAILRIVEMGFGVDEAKSALRQTDRGDGLRVDAAVEMLLRRQRV